MEDDNQQSCDELAARLGVGFSGGRGPTTIKEKKQSEIGHNSMADVVAKARKGLGMVAEGEEKTFEGWLIYGAALNEGREMFPEDDKGFGKWKQREIYSDNLSEKPCDHDEAAAMWAAEDLERLEEVREANPRVRTVRGLHAKWKDSQSTFSPAEWTDSERSRKASIEAVENLIKAGQALQEGRDMHKSDNAFHEWCEREFPDLHRNTRTALMQIGSRLSAHKNVHTSFSVLSELFASSVPDELVEDFLSSDEPVKVKEVQEAKREYKQIQEDPEGR